MSESSPRGAEPAGQSAGHAGDSAAAPMYGPPSPLVPLETALRRPATTGLVVTLLALNLLFTGWLALRQEKQNAEVRAASYFGDASGTGADLSQPQVCWLLGVVAAGQGKGSEVAKMALTGDAMSDCATYAGRGARGQSMDGS